MSRVDKEDPTLRLDRNPRTQSCCNHLLLRQSLDASGRLPGRGSPEGSAQRLAYALTQGDIERSISHFWFGGRKRMFVESSRGNDTQHGLAVSSQAIHTIRQAIA
jgi:hypothetical protein